MGSVKSKRDQVLLLWWHISYTSSHFAWREGLHVHHGGGHPSTTPVCCDSLREEHINSLATVFEASRKLLTSMGCPTRPRLPRPIHHMSDFCWMRMAQRTCHDLACRSWRSCARSCRATGLTDHMTFTWDSNSNGAIVAIIIPM